MVFWQNQTINGQFISYLLGNTMKKNEDAILYNETMQIRQKKIVEILKEKKDWITGKELSTMLSVSDRTIRNDMELFRFNV